MNRDVSLRTAILDCLQETDYHAKSVGSLMVCPRWSAMMEPRPGGGWRRTGGMVTMRRAA
jgi:hypothetical protein